MRPCNMLMQIKDLKSCFKTHLKKYSAPFLLSPSHSLNTVILSNSCGVVSIYIFMCVHKYIHMHFSIVVIKVNIV